MATSKLLPYQARALATKAGIFASNLAARHAAIESRYAALLDMPTFTGVVAETQSALADYEATYATSQSLAASAKAVLKTSLAVEKTKADDALTTALATKDAEIAELLAAVRAKRDEKDALTKNIRAAHVSKVLALRAEGEAAIAMHASKADIAATSLQAAYVQLQAIYKEYKNLVEAAFNERGQASIVSEIIPREPARTVKKVVAKEEVVAAAK